MDEIKKLQNMVKIRQKHINNYDISAYVDQILGLKLDEATKKKEWIKTLVNAKYDDLDMLKTQKKQLDEILAHRSKFRDASRRQRLLDNFLGLIGIIIIASVIYLFVKVIIWFYTPSPRHIPTEMEKEISLKIDVESYLKNHYLRDPDSYQSISWGAMTTENGKRTIRHTFRAKNGFGGYVVNSVICTSNIARGTISCVKE